MARRKYYFTEEKIRRFQKEKRGQGTGAQYKPWLIVSDVPSMGKSSRPYCRKTDRVHHLLSQNEFYLFLLLWWDINVIDIREQYPLDRKETFEIAALLGINHPIDNVTGAVWVLTTDFLVTLEINGIISTIAIAAKVASDIKSENDRIKDKLEIERQYWIRRNISWSIFIKERVDVRVVKNLEWLLMGDQSREISNEQAIEADVLRYLLNRQLLSPTTPLKQACQEIDRIHGTMFGTSLAISRRLMARKKITFDLTIEIPQDAPLSQFSINEGCYEE